MNASNNEERPRLFDNGLKIWKENQDNYRSYPYRILLIKQWKGRPNNGWKREKTHRIKTNNQEELIRKQNESDATSWWVMMVKDSLLHFLFLVFHFIFFHDFEITNKYYLISFQSCNNNSKDKWDFISNTKYNFILLWSLQVMDLFLLYFPSTSSKVSLGYRNSFILFLFN